MPTQDTSPRPRQETPLIIKSPGTTEEIFKWKKRYSIDRNIAYTPINYDLKYNYVTTVVDETIDLSNIPVPDTLLNRANSYVACIRMDITTPEDRNTYRQGLYIQCQAYKIKTPNYKIALEIQAALAIHIRESGEDRLCLPEEIHIELSTGETFRIFETNPNLYLG